jgi:hypothetical protein
MTFFGTGKKALDKRRQALARLAATEILAMIERDVDAHATRDRDASVQRLERFLEIPRNEALRILDGMLVRLREAPLI